jgi:integrase
MNKLPPIPKYVYDRLGMKVDVSLPSWPINDPSRTGSLDWRKITNITGDALHALKLYMCDRLAKQAPLEVHNTFREIREVTVLDLAVIQSLTDMTQELFTHYRNRLRDQSNEYRLHRVRAWYLWMATMEFPGVDHSLVVELSKWRIPGNPRGDAVMSRDPLKGPLSSDEYLALLKTVQEDGEHSQALAAVLLGLELGLNSKHMLLLEERDLHRFTDFSDGSVKYQLDVPRIKKRQSRREVRRRGISLKLGDLLNGLVADNLQRCGGPDAHRPILCRTQEGMYQVGAGKLYPFHLTTECVGRLVREYAIRKAICSSRTGKTIRLSPRRLRYTYATRMAEQGVPSALLADLLDHSNLQHVMVYVKARSAAVERLDKALERDAGPIFRRFAGRLVESEKTATPSDPAARVYGQARVLASLGGIGTCGRGTLCNLYPPYSCYLCAHFQPWKSAPHEKMLEDVLAYRDALVAKATGPSDRMPHQLDDVIAAIREVVERQQMISATRRRQDD